MIMMMGIGTPSSQSSIERPMSASFCFRFGIVAPIKRASYRFRSAPASPASAAMASAEGWKQRLKGAIRPRAGNIRSPTSKRPPRTTCMAPRRTRRALRITWLRLS